MLEHEALLRTHEDTHVDALDRSRNCSSGRLCLSGCDGDNLCTNLRREARLQ